MALTMNQNWFGSSFPNPLNIDNFIVLAILTRDGGGGSTGEDGGEGGEASGQGNCIILFLDNKILIQVFKDFTYLPRGPLGKYHFISL